MTAATFLCLRVFAASADDANAKAATKVARKNFEWK